MKILGGITASRKSISSFLLHKVTLNTTHRVSYIKYFNNLLKKGEEEEELVQRASFISTLFDPILVTTSSGSRTSMRNNSMTNMEELMKVFDSLMWIYSTSRSLQCIRTQLKSNPTRGSV